MTRVEKAKSVVDLVAGSLCLASGGLNAWNMVGVGITGWRVTTVSVLTLVGLYLLARYFKPPPDQT